MQDALQLTDNGKKITLRRRIYTEHQNPQPPSPPPPKKKKTRYQAVRPKYTCNRLHAYPCLTPELPKTAPQQRIPRHCAH